MATICSSCGFQHHPGDRGRARRGVVPVVDKVGSSFVCVLCAVQLVTAVDDGAVGLTIVLGEPQQAVT